MLEHSVNISVEIVEMTIVLRKPDGGFTETEKQPALLLASHFPQCTGTDGIKTPQFIQGLNLQTTSERHSDIWLHTRAMEKRKIYIHSKNGKEGFNPSKSLPLQTHQLTSFFIKTMQQVCDNYLRTANICAIC